MQDKRIRLLPELVVCWAAGALAVCYYPLGPALFASLSPLLLFEVALPVGYILGLLSVPIILLPMLEVRQFRAVLTLVVLYVLLVLASGVANHCGVPEICAELARVTVPFCIALSARAFSLAKLERGVAAVCTFIWMMNTVTAIYFHNTSGWCGNPNLMSAASIAAAPWVIVLFCISVRVRVWRWLVGTIVVGGTCWSVILAECRASIVAVCVALAVVALSTGRFYRMLVAIVGVGFCLGVVGYWCVGQAAITRVLARDIRIPLWYTTAKMVATAPCLGYGPGAYEDRFATFKADDLDRQLHRADRYEHPHNEILYTAASLGLPATVCWLGLIAVAGCQRPRSTVDRCNLFSLMTLLAHGLFDKALAISPSSVMFLLFLGIAIAKKIPRRRVFLGSDSAVSYVVLRLSLLSLVLGFAVHSACRAIDAGQMFRRVSILVNNIHHARFAPDEFEKEMTRAYNLAKDAAGKHRGDPRCEALAGIIGSEFIGDPVVGRSHYERILADHHNLGRSEWLLGRAWLRSCLEDQIDQATREAAAKNAFEHFCRQLKCQPYNTRAMEDATVALYYGDNPSLVCAMNDRAVAAYQSRFKLNCFVSGVSERSRLEAWLSADGSLERNRFNASTALINGERLNEYDSFSSIIGGSKRFSRAGSFARLSTFSAPDAELWNGFQELYATFPSPLKAVHSLKTISIEAGHGPHFRWPWEVWRQKKGTALDVACLACTVFSMHGCAPVMVDGAAGPEVLVRYCEKMYCLSCIDWQMTEFSIENMGQTVQRAHVFVFPQACCHRNRALFGVLRLDEQLPRFPEGLPVCVARAKLDFPNLGAMDVLSEPFQRLDADLMKQSR